MIMRLTYRTIVSFYSLRTSRILSPLPYVAILLPLISGDNEPTLWHQGVTGNRLIRSVCHWYGTIRAISVRDIAHVWNRPCHPLQGNAFRRRRTSYSSTKQFVSIETMGLINLFNHNVKVSMMTLAIHFIVTSRHQQWLDNTLTIDLVVTVKRCLLLYLKRVYDKHYCNSITSESALQTSGCALSRRIYLRPFSFMYDILWRHTILF